MRKYFGILAAIIVLWTMIFAYILHPSFDIVLPALSDLGKYPESELVFNLGLIIAGATQVVFADYLSKLFELKGLSRWVVLWSGLGLAGIGAIPIPADEYTYFVQRALHWTLALSTFSTMLITFLIIGIKAKNNWLKWYPAPVALVSIAVLFLTRSILVFEVVIMLFIMLGVIWLSFVPPTSMLNRLQARLISFISRR